MNTFCHSTYNNHYKLLEIGRVLTDTLKRNSHEWRLSKPSFDLIFDETSRAAIFIFYLI